jgi:PHD/YefM family antitoxin component YafN of YafNO toxin-antitoxin module
VNGGAGRGPPSCCSAPDDLAALEESLDILQDDELMESLRTSRRQAAAGDTVPLRDQV